MNSLVPKSRLEYLGGALALVALVPLAVALVDVFVAWQSPLSPAPASALVMGAVAGLGVFFGLLMLIAGRLGRLVRVQEDLVELLAGRP